MMPRAGGQYVFLREAYGPSSDFSSAGRFSSHPNRNDRRGRDCLCEVCRCLRSGDRDRSKYLVYRSISLQLCDQSFHGTISGRRPHSPPHLEEHARPRTGKLVQNTFTLAKTAALIGLIVVGLSLGWKATSAARRPRGGIVGERLDAAGRATRSRGRCPRALDFWQSDVGRSSRRPPGQTSPSPEARCATRAELWHALAHRLRCGGRCSTSWPTSLMSRLCRSRESSMPRRIASRSRR